MCGGSRADTKGRSEVGGRVGGEDRGVGAGRDGVEGSGRRWLSFPLRSAGVTLLLGLQGGLWV